MKPGARFLLGMVTALLAVGAGVYGRNAYLAEARLVPLPAPRQAIPLYIALKPEMFEPRSFPQPLAELLCYSGRENWKGGSALPGFRLSFQCRGN